MARILHLTSDYPDQIDAHKTYAVKNLITNARRLEHHVISLNRTIQPWNETALQSNNDVLAIAYLGMPYGILLKSFLLRVARRLERILVSCSARPDLIHSHKLTFEGIVGYYLSQRLRLPHVCTIRGDTDLKLIKYKLGYGDLYREIIDHSEALFFLAPWTVGKMENWYIGGVAPKATVLPNIVGLKFNAIARDSTSSRKLVTVCHLKNYKRKNIARLIRAVDSSVTEGNDIRLDIIGGGAKSVWARAEKDIAKARHSERFNLLGHMEPVKIREELPNYAGLVLPSFPETFGMVYLEALQAGIPVLHSKDAGVDGFFPNRRVSVSVDPRSVESIKAGIIELINNQLRYKENIRALIASGGLEKFDAGSIAKSYEETVASVLSSVL